MINLTCPYALFLLLFPLLIRAILPRLQGMHGDGLKIPFLKDLEKIEGKNKIGLDQHISYPKNGNIVFLYLIWGLLCLAAARPILTGEPFRPKNFGREIVMVMDISTSMLEEDYALNGRRISRIDAVKIAAYNFLQNRINDKIGLVLFGTQAYLQSPPTFDNESVKNIILDMQPGMAGKSTSIGDAIGIAVQALDNENSDAAKIIILLTDGENNDGSITPAQALNLAKKSNVKIYTIGVGNDQSIMQSFFSSLSGMKVNRDNPELKALAAQTSGQYFRADSTESLLKVYEAIDALEAAENEDNFVKNITELYYIPLLAAILLAFLVLLWERLRK